MARGERERERERAETERDQRERDQREAARGAKSLVVTTPRHSKPGIAPL